MIELKFIKSSMSEKEKIRKKADALIERIVERMISDEVNFFKSVIMMIEMMLAFEAI
jgi:hypothetical protein